jgi:hypothetical protein
MFVQRTEAPFISDIRFYSLCLFFIWWELPLFTIFVIRIIIAIASSITTALAHEKVAMLLVYRIISKMWALLV